MGVVTLASSAHIAVISLVLALLLVSAPRNAVHAAAVAKASGVECFPHAQRCEPTTPTTTVIDVRVCVATDVRDGSSAQPLQQVRDLLHNYGSLGRLDKLLKGDGALNNNGRWCVIVRFPNSPAGLLARTELVRAGTGDVRVDAPPACATGCDTVGHVAPRHTRCQALLQVHGSANTAEDRVRQAFWRQTGLSLGDADIQCDHAASSTAYNRAVQGETAQLRVSLQQTALAAAYRDLLFGDSVDLALAGVVQRRVSCVGHGLDASSMKEVLTMERAFVAAQGRNATNTTSAVPSTTTPDAPNTTMTTTVLTSIPTTVAPTTTTTTSTTPTPTTTTATTTTTTVAPTTTTATTTTTVAPTTTTTPVPTTTTVPPTTTTTLSPTTTTTLSPTTTTTTTLSPTTTTTTTVAPTTTTTTTVVPTTTEATTLTPSPPPTTNVTTGTATTVSTTVATTTTAAPTTTTETPVPTTTTALPTTTNVTTTATTTPPPTTTTATAPPPATTSATASSTTSSLTETTTESPATSLQPRTPGPTADSAVVELSFATVADAAQFEPRLRALLGVDSSEYTLSIQGTSARVTFLGILGPERAYELIHDPTPAERSQWGLTGAAATAPPPPVAVRTTEDRKRTLLFFFIAPFGAVVFVIGVVVVVRRVRQQSAARQAAEDEGGEGGDSAELLSVPLREGDIS